MKSKVCWNVRLLLWVPELLLTQDDLTFFETHGNIHPTKKQELPAELDLLHRNYQTTLTHELFFHLFG